MPDVADLRVKISLDGADKVASGLKQADSGVSSFASNAGKLGGAVGSVATQFAAFGVVAGGAVVAGLGAAIAKASDFEAGMSRVKAAANASSSEMAALGAAAIQLGADTDLAGIGAKDAATAMEELAKGGVSVSDQLGGATKGALLLASAGSISVADAAGLATKSMNIFGLAGTDVAHVADLLSAGANKSATDVGQLGQAFNQSAAVAKNAGLDIETLTGTLAFFAQRGMEGSDAGTSLKTALLALQAPTDVAAKTMADLGINVRDSEGHMLPMADIADVLKDRLSGLSDAQRDMALKTIFGNDAIRVGIGLFEGGGSAIRDWTAKVNDAGNAAITGATINDNLKGSLSQLGAVLETGAIQFGGKLTPIIRTATDEMAKFIQGVMDSPRAQAAFDSFATSASTALTAFFAKVKDPAFQDSAKQWATAALDVGRAVVTLGQDVANVLGPPLREAVTWFNGLDQAGKEQVISFGLVAASAVKFRDELGTVKSVVEDVIKSFAAKEAAKTSLTAANKLLAGSAGGTSTALKVVGVAALDAGVVIAGTAALAYLGMKAVGEYGKANQDVASSTRYATEQEALKQVALANSGSAYLDVIGPFKSFVAVQDEWTRGTQTANQEWDTYVASLRASGDAYDAQLGGLLRLSTGVTGTTGVMPAFSSAMQASGYELGNAGNQGAGFNNTLVGLSSAANSLAATLPPVGAGLGTAATAMGDVATNSTAMGGGLASAAANLGAVQANSIGVGAGLAGAAVAMGDIATNSTAMGAGLNAAAVSLGAVAIAGDSAIGSLAGTTAAFGGTGLAAGAFASSVATAQAMLDNYDTALQGLNQEHSHTAGYLSILQGEWDKLNVATQNGSNVTAEQAARYAELAPLIGYLNAVQGENATQTVATAQAGVLQMQALEQTKSAATEAAASLTAIPTAVTTNVSAPGAATAGTDIAAVATAATTVPPTATTTVSAPGALGSAQEIGAHAAAALAVPQSATTSVTAPGALGSAVSIGAVTAAALAVPSATTTTSSTVNTAQSAGQIAGVSTAIALVPKSFTVTAHVDVSGALANIATLRANMPSSPAKEGPFKTLPNWQWVFSNFAEGVTGALAEVNRLGGGISDTVAAGAKRTAEIMGSLATTIKSGMEAITGLAAFKPATMAPTDAQRGGFMAALTPLLADLTAATTMYSEESAKVAARWADTSGKLLGVVKTGLDALAGLVTFVAPAQANIAAFKSATESLVTSLGDSAAVMDADFVANAGVWAGGAGKSLAIVKAGADGLRALIDFVAPSQANIGAFKFATEFLVQSLGDSAAVMDGTFAANAGVWATGAGKALGILKAGVDGFAALATFVAPSQTAIGAFKFATEFLVQSIADTATAMDAKAVAAAATWSDGAGKVLAVIKVGVDGLTALAAFVAPAPAAIDAFAVAVGQIVARFAEAAQRIGTEGVAAAGAFGTSAKLAVDTIKTGLDAFKSFKDMVIPSAGAIDELVAAVSYIVGRFRDMADAMGHDALAKAQDFGRAVEGTAKSLQTAIGTFKSLTEAPFKGAMTKIMVEFNGDLDVALAMMIEAHGNAAQFETEARMYKEAMLNAATSIAAGNAALANAALPGNSLGKDMTRAGANLGDSLAQGVRETLQIKSPSQVMATIGGHVVAGLVSGMDATAQDAAKKAADVAKGIADAVTATLGAMKALGGLSLSALPSGGQVGAFVAFTGQLVTALSGAAASLTTTALDAASKYAEGASKVVALVGSGVDALGKLATVALPATTAVYALDRLIRAAVNDFAVIAEQVGAEMLTRATDFAGGAGTVAEAVGKGADALGKLATVALPANAAIYAFGKALYLIVQDFATIADTVTADMLARAAGFAEGAGKVAETVGKGVDAFTKLATYVAPLPATIYDFGKTIRIVVADFAAIAEMVGSNAATSAGQFADAAGKVVGILGNGVDGFTKLATYKGIADTLIAPFVETVRTLVAAIGQAAAQFTTEGLTLAGQFADAASKGVGILSNGVDGFTKLATYKGVGDAAIGAFVATVTTLVRGIGAASTQFTSDGLKLSGDFADAASKAVGILGAGVTGFASLATFVGPTQATIDAFLATVRYTVARFGEMATILDADGTKATAAFADAAGKALGAVGAGVTAFKDMATLVLPVPAAIDDLVNTIRYAVGQVAAAAGLVGGDTLAAATAFGTAASGVFAALKSGLDLFTALGKLDGPVTTAWLQPLVDLMGGVLTRSATLVTQAQQLRSDADIFAATLGQAFAGFTNAGAGLGGFGAGPALGSPVPLAAANGGGGGGGGTTNVYVTITGNTILSDDPATADALARLLKPRLAQVGGY